MFIGSLKILYFWSYIKSALRTLLRAILILSTIINNLNNPIYQPGMSIDHPILIQDYISYQFKLVRSNTYKFFQNWLRVHTSLIKHISIAFRDNYFMLLFNFSETSIILNVKLDIFQKEYKVFTPQNPP